MRVAVIGGTAFIGRALVHQLAKAGHELLVFHRGLTHADLPEGVEELLADRRDLFENRQRFREFKPDVVVDMICMTEHQAQTTIDTFEGIADRLVVISSQDVYRAFGRVQGFEPGPPDPVPLTEDSPLREKLYLYRNSEQEGRFEWSQDYEKVMVERVAQDEPDLPATVLRLPAVYGPGDYQHRLFGYATRIAEERPAIVIGRGLAGWRWTRGYVDNVAAAIRLAVEDDRSAGRTYNVGDPDAFTEIEWIQNIGRAVGWKGNILVVEDERFSVGLNHEQDWVADTSRIRNELGFEEPVSLLHALQHSIEWELHNPPEGYQASGHQYDAEDEMIARASNQSQDADG
ncbi:MAG: NAD-dependent epimerase/dehydratase family protein [Chloroflexi bacterium]|nr:NAD-dependent epimerase/dehydratase family protein [Chloroflexota bacterium]